MTFDETTLRLRVARVDDTEAVERIWKSGTATSLGFYSAIPTVGRYFRDCISNQDDTFKFWVACDNNDRVIGWQSLQPTEANPITRRMVAVASTYVDPACRFRGVGSMLLKHALLHADHTKLH